MTKAGGGARIALVTMAGLDVEQSDDARLLAALRAQGDVPIAVAWDEASVEWGGFDLVWIRSCWDYHLRYAEFRAWLDRADRAGARWLNPAPAIVWNSHKRYLLDLRDDGVAVPALELVPQGAAFDAARLGAWADVVIKPAVSASAYRTWLASTVPIEESAARVEAMVREGDVILQRYVPEIASRGEWSLIVVCGELCHAVRRVPRVGDFRSQLDYGAVLTREEPPAALRALADAALASAARRTGGVPYVARLDLVETPDGPVVMEVELIEPSLFLAHAPGAAERIAAAVRRRIG